MCLWWGDGGRAESNERPDDVAVVLRILVRVRLRVRLPVCLKIGCHYLFLVAVKSISVRCRLRNQDRVAGRFVTFYRHGLTEIIAAVQTFGDFKQMWRAQRTRHPIALPGNGNFRCAPGR